MPLIDEASRHAIHGHLAEQMGDELAGVFMSLLPRVPWEEFATKHDLAVLRDDVAGIKHDMLALEVRLNERLDDKLAATGAGLRTELNTGIAGLRTELNTGIAGLRTEMSTEIGSLRTELSTEIGSLRTELSTEIGSLRTELRTEIGSLRTELHTGIAGLRTEMHQGFRRMTVWVSSLQVATLGAVAALTRLG